MIKPRAAAGAAAAASGCCTTTRSQLHSLRDRAFIIVAVVFDVGGSMVELDFETLDGEYRKWALRS